MLNLTPFLLFNDNCAEAMAFYQSCLGGELTITTVGDTSMKAQVPPEKHHKVPPNGPAGPVRVDHRGHLGWRVRRGHR
jgi:hypothetical protein